MTDTSVPDVDLEPHRELRITVCITADLHADYVNAASYPTVKERVDRVIKETLLSGLGTTYLDGKPHTIWGGWEYDYEVSYADAPDTWVVEGSGRQNDR